MNSKKLLNLYALKWNPFIPDLPTEALLFTPKIESFAWRIENLVQEGGFALITGDPGTGKSVALRSLAERLKAIRDVAFGVITRPQSKIVDFYRELGEVFQVRLSSNNRYGGFKLLREKWKAYVESNLLRPVILVDEAQETPIEVLSEIRLLSSANFDSTRFLTVILCGDSRLPDLFQHKSLISLGTRIRTRLNLDYASKDELRELLLHAMSKAGNSKLLSDELVDTLVDHAAGNFRTMMNMAAEILGAGTAKEGVPLDEKLYLEVFQRTPARIASKSKLKEPR